MKFPLSPVLITLAFVAPAAAQGPTLVPATLRSISPAGIRRGQQVRLVFDGINLSGAEAVIFDDPAITSTVAAGANANQAIVMTQIGETARAGLHRAFLRTRLGTTGSVTFAVGAWPELPEREGSTAEPATLPVTFTGTLATAGDVDELPFRAEGGQELVFEVLASQLRSRLQSVLTLVDGSGRVLAETMGSDGQPDATLVYRVREAGTYTLRIRDLENAAGGDVTYRINAGPFIHAASVFPLGFRQGEAEVALAGANLAGAEQLRVSGEAGGWGSTLTVRESVRGPLLTPVRLAVGEEPEALEAEPNDAPTAAQALQLPITVNGRISGAEGKGDADFFRFRARKGQELVLEVNARRLGSPLDSVIEVLDAKGNRVERATLRCVAETATTLSDRDSATTGLRLLTWNDLAMNDLLYVRGEVVQITLLPRGPDEDVRFRAVRGQRVALFDTTPIGHAMNTPVYKVQVHPPGKSFPSNGMPVYRLHYRNDDGGPLYGKDSRVLFTAPADGEYVVRINDVRGEGSDRHAYRLTIRERRPAFRLTLSSEHPNVPTGSSVPVEVTADRIDGYDGPIDVKLEGLPAGITATPGVIEAGETTATLLLTAAPGARPAEAALRLVGRAQIGGKEHTAEFPLGGGRCFLTVLPKADLAVRADTERLTIRPGEQQYLEASIVRQNGFAGRVPIDLKNLPYGVRVLDIGLNGVLITEEGTSRRFTVYCEPWVKPQQRLVYCTVRTETSSGAPTDVSAAPILLDIQPSTRQAAAAPVR